jgi:iron-sulfur cluster assembly protein
LLPGFTRKITESAGFRNFVLKSVSMEAITVMKGIYISDKAKARVEKLMQEDSMGPDHFVRVSVVSGGCSGLSYKMDFDHELKPGDQVFEDKGIRLVTDRKSVLYLFDTTLDFSDGLSGKGFHFINPNASRTCACGESFSV